MAKRKHPEFDKASCAGCSVCVVNCPKDILRITKPSHHGSIHNVAYLTDREACIGCGICAKECPIGAIYMVEDGEKPVYINNTKGLFDMFNKIYCRIFQAVMKVANYFLGYRMPEYISGPGSIKKLPGLMKAKGANNALVVTDSNLMQLGLLDNMLKALDEAGLKYSIFCDLAVNPTTKNVEEGDLIAIDIPNCSIELKVSEETLAARRSAWVCPEPKVKTGYLARYAKLISSADKGAILE